MRHLTAALLALALLATPTTPAHNASAALPAHASPAPYVHVLPAPSAQPAGCSNDCEDVAQEPGATVAQPPAVTLATPVPTPAQPTPTPHAYAALQLSDADVDLMARVLWSEARGEPDEGQRAVVQCMLDRLQDGTWGDTMRGVLLAKGQFAAPGSLCETQREIVLAVLRDGPELPGCRVLYFQETKSYRDWYETYLLHVGVHAFYGFGEAME